MNSIPTVTRNLLIVNLIAFLATVALEPMGIDLAALLGLHFFLADDFNVVQLFTYMFLHAGFMHILFNMFALWMFGRVIESVWGPKKFLFYYISCGVGAGLMQELAQTFQLYYILSSQNPTLGFLDTFAIGHAYSQELNAWTTIGASGAVYAILLAFGMTFPNERIFIFPLPVPIKAKWFVMIYAAIELFSAFNSSGDNVAHMAHLGGMLFGFLMIRYWNNNPTAGYGRSNGAKFFDNLKENFERYRSKAANKGKSREQQSHEETRRETDWEYNARKKANQEEIDRILDKIRKSGYDSLTKEEKQRLFDSGND